MVLTITPDLINLLLKKKSLIQHPGCLKNMLTAQPKGNQNSIHVNNIYYVMILAI
jgi:hypothetical protein|tara:strand:- start:1072 stop:1236 length:165 start_codon:yes stop_codon:yes gene_type:complete